MRNRLLLAGIGLLLIAASALVFSLARLAPPPPAASGELRASPAAHSSEWAASG